MNENSGFLLVGPMFTLLLKTQLCLIPWAQQPEILSKPCGREAKTSVETAPGQRAAISMPLPAFQPSWILLFSLLTQEPLAILGCQCGEIGHWLHRKGFPFPAHWPDRPLPVFSGPCTGHLRLPICQALGAVLTSVLTRRCRTCLCVHILGCRGKGSALTGGGDDSRFCLFCLFLGRELLVSAWMRKED